MMTTHFTLGILGGMGPAATMYFYNKLLSLPPASCDQEHIPTLILSDPTIPDRTKAILDQSLGPVSHKLTLNAKRLEDAGASCVAIPCNTAHYWFNDIQNAISIPVLNMIDLTARFLSEQKASKVGLLSTLGTAQTGLYQKALAHHGVPVQLPIKAHQTQTMAIILSIKANGHLKELKTSFLTIIDALKEQGVDAIILGCTELPLLFENELPEGLVDPMTILAQAVISQQS